MPLLEIRNYSDNGTDHLGTRALFVDGTLYSLGHPYALRIEADRLLEQWLRASQPTVLQQMRQWATARRAWIEQGYQEATAYHLWGG